MAVRRGIRITFRGVSVSGEIDTSKTADAIWEALPIHASANTWGDEVYFSIPVKRELENAEEIVHEGDLGYWPPGSAFCIFFGLIPASRGKEIRPASAVNVFGRIIGDLKAFRSVRDGDEITLDKTID